MSSTKRRIGFSGFVMGAIATVVQVTVGACGSQPTSAPVHPAVITPGTQATVAATRADAPTGTSTAVVSPTRVSAPGGDVNVRAMARELLVVGASPLAGSALTDGRSDTGISGENGDYVIRISLAESQIISGVSDSLYFIAAS